MKKGESFFVAFDRLAVPPRVPRRGSSRPAQTTSQTVVSSDDAERMVALRADVVADKCRDTQPAAGTEYRYVPPQSNQMTVRFSFPIEGDPNNEIVFSSEFDSGNLRLVERTAPSSFNLHVCNDCFGTPHETQSKAWFYFKVHGVPRGTQLSFVLVHMNFAKNYGFGWAPVMSLSSRPGSFTRVLSRVSVLPSALMQPILPAVEDDEVPDVAGDGSSTSIIRPTHLDVAFDVNVDQNLVSCDGQDHLALAYSFPFSYSRVQRYLANLVPDATNGVPFQPTGVSPDPGATAIAEPSIEKPSKYATDAFVARELLTLSLDQLRVDLLTISGTNGMDFTRTLPSPSTSIDAERPIAFEAFASKQLVLLTSRVHPGETPANHVLQGMLDFLLHPTDARACTLRKHFAFLVVPLVNPDGVVRGNTRADPQGQNLNRQYKGTDARRFPTVHAIRRLMLACARTNRLALYMDLHAHANKRGAFLFGNAMPAADQISSLLFAKLAAVNCAYFHFPSCNFSEQNMFVKGVNGDGKDGSSRVVLHLETGFVHSYTFECSFVSGHPSNAVAGLNHPSGISEIPVTDSTPSPKYSVSHFAEMGKSFLVALLDLRGMNPVSRLSLTSFRNLRGVVLWIHRSLVTEAYDQQRRQSFSAAISAATVPQTYGSLVSPTIPLEPDLSLVPNVFTTRGALAIPPTTIYHLRQYLNSNADTQGMCKHIFGSSTDDGSAKGRVRRRSLPAK